MKYLLFVLLLTGCSSFMVTPDQCVNSCGFKGVKDVCVEVIGSNHKVTCTCKE
jgi:hypothetical protein